MVTSLHYYIQLQGNIKKFIVVSTISRPFEMEYGVYSELAWQQDDIQWQVLMDTTESVDFIVQIFSRII